MTQRNLTERQKREAEFYREYARRQQVEQVDFAPVEGHEARPWNPYWFVYALARRRYVHPEQRVLDFGCGNGVASLRLAYLGYQVEGFDISPDNIRLARQLAQRYPFGERCRFQVMPAEQLDYPDNHFDLIVGIDVLHHVEIGPAIHQTHRVLKPGGVAIFKEHVEAPLVEPLRNTALMRKLAPRTKSLDHHITDDERKLSATDLHLIENRFARVQSQRFTLISRLDRFLSPESAAMRGRLQQLDLSLMTACPPLSRLAGTVVLTCHKQAESPSQSQSRQAA